MANENKITAAFVQQFHDTYELATQQEESRLLKTVTNRGKIEGESFTINDMSAVEMSPSGARYGDTNWTIPDSGVRTALMSDWDLFIPIERRDEPKLKANPQDKYMKNLVTARERKIDDIIYSNLVGPVNRTTVSDAGVKTTTAVNLPISQIILSGPSIREQIIKAKELFRENECDEFNGEELYIVYSAKMMSKILADTTLTSAEYLEGRMIQQGKVASTWMGFNWIPYEKLANGAGGATERRAVAYCKSALHFGDADITGFDISVRNDKKNITQVGGVHSFGAGRSNEKKVVAIDFLI